MEKWPAVGNRTINFSVALSVYSGDRLEWFKDAFSSILNQTWQPEEIVLVLDGPVSRDLRIFVEEISRLHNNILRVIQLPTNTGHGNARRVGLQNCSNDLVALMDSDDISLCDRFEKQLALFAVDPELSVVGGQIAEFIDSPDNIAGIRSVPLTDLEIKSYLKKRCPFNQVTVMMKKTAVEKAGGFLDWYCNEDYYLWVRMCQTGAKFANLKETLVNVRVGKEMYRRRGGWRYFKSEARLQMYMKKNGIIGFWQFIFNVFIRLCVQVLLPDQLRGVIFQRFFRVKAGLNEKV